MGRPNDYPRVLVVASGKINFCDSSNNGLLLRNLFGKDWPIENLAQIYSGGDNGDAGFFGKYYKLGPSERRFGNLFFHLKPASAPQHADSLKVLRPPTGLIAQFKAWCKYSAKRILIDSGIYELLFRTRLSNELTLWINEFKPDIIFAQGYTLSFTLLPLLIKQSTNARLAVLPTDDWPKYQYSGMHGEPLLFRWLMRPVIEHTAARFFAQADIPLAFGDPMSAEYARRYGKFFTNINHADDPARFNESRPRRVHDQHTLTIAAIGTFNDFRWPLLLDVNEACEALTQNGINVRLAVFTSSISAEARMALAKANYIDIYPDPGNDDLPSYLKGSDALLLIEGFDKGFVSAIQLSISSKAHLFMFSQRPIIVYAAPDTGIAKYALDYEWAAVVSNRSINELSNALKSALVDPCVASELVSKADRISHERHTHQINQSRFRSALLQRY